MGQEINIELLGMVDYDLHQYGVFMFIKQINQQININYGVFMFIKLGFTTVDGKKKSGLIFTGALLTAGRVVGRKGRMMVMVMTCCHYCDSSDDDSNDMQ